MSVMSRHVRSVSQRLSLTAFCPSRTPCHANTLSRTGSRAFLVPLFARRPYSLGHSYAHGDQIVDLPEHPAKPGPPQSHHHHHHGPSAQAVVAPKPAAPPAPRLRPQRRFILPISADTTAGVYRVADQLAASISEMRASRGQAEDLPHPAYQQDAAITKLAGSLTAAATRRPGPWRSFTTTLTGFTPELPEKKTSSDPPSAQRPAVAVFISPPVLVSDNQGEQAVSFIFPGQGSQWPQMGQRLARTFPAFARSLRESEAVLAELQREGQQQQGVLVTGTSSSWWLTRELEAPEATTRLARGRADNAVYDIIMPTLTALRIALVDLLASWGVRPASVVGHSLGEVGAAYCSGALSRRSALRVIYFRGRSAAELAKHPRRGDMMVVSVSVDKLESEYLPALTSGQAWVAGSLPVSGTGGPDLHTTMVSGDTAAVRELGERLGREDIRCRVLGQMLAWHSPHFDPLLPEYLRCTGGSEGRLDGPPVDDDAAGCSQFSSLTGGLVPASRLRTAAYWGDSLVSPASSTAPVSAAAAEADIERRVVCMPPGYVRRLAASAAAELEHMHQLAEAVSAAEHDPFWVSSGDLTTAFIARVCMRHADPPPAPEDTVNIINAMSMRDALKDDLLPAGTAHVGNAVTGVRAVLPANDVLTEPLAHPALAVRRSIQKLMNRDALEAAFAAAVKRAPALIARTQSPSRGEVPGRGLDQMRIIFITNWSKARLYDTDFSAAVVSHATDSDSNGRKSAKPSCILWNSSGDSLRYTATVVTDEQGNIWWSCQLPKGDWAKIEKDFDNDHL